MAYVVSLINSSLLLIVIRFDELNDLSGWCLLSLGLQIGDHVVHRSFGNGVIVQLYRNAQGIVADVKFGNVAKYVDSTSLTCDRVENTKWVLGHQSSQRPKGKIKYQEKQREQERSNQQQIEKKGLKFSLASIFSEKQRQLEQKRKKDEELQIARKTTLLTRLNDIFESDFISADRLFSSAPDADLVSKTEYEELKSCFVRNWARSTFLKDDYLDLEQASSVAAIDGDIKVTARAGSGKTRTLVTRAIFLQKHCHVAPQEMLLLAFNSTAAAKLKEDLEKFLEGPLPYILNFHKLAHALVHPGEDLLYDDENSGRLGLSREIQAVIDDHLKSNEYCDVIRNLMLAHFRDDWEQIVSGGFELTLEEFLAHRRNLPRESLKGDYVKSFGEKLISNTLFEHDVDYRYERNFRWDDFNYRPDFTIPSKRGKGGVIIEYFGLQNDADYDDLSEKKRAFWSMRPEWKFLEFTPVDIAKNGKKAFIKILTGELVNAGVICKLLPEEEIWKRIQIRAVDSFTKAMRQFISRCRKLNLNPHKLREMIDVHKPCSTSERLFLDVGISVYQGYLKHLTEKQQEDFDGIMWRAVELLRNGQTHFVRNQGREKGNIRDLRFIMINEFQDFSNMFFELMNSIRSVNPSAQFFCVGDDWQAINAFAGSDLDFFENFINYFKNTSQLNICTNYRSLQEVVTAANALMSGLGVPAQANRMNSGWIRLCRLDDFRPTALEQARHNGDETTPALLRLVRSLLDNGHNVVMLSRRGSVPWYINYNDQECQESNAQLRFLNHICSYLPEEDRGRLTISTVHKYKGLDQDSVIILDAKANSYPLIHPHWFFLRIFDNSIDKIEQEERRLFYVAITRAKNALALVTETRSRSPYIDDIQRHMDIKSLVWEDLPPILSLDIPRLEIRVSNASNVRDQLKKLGYKWNDPKKYWYRAIKADGFSFDLLLDQPWVNSTVNIEVYSESLDLLYER